MPDTALVSDMRCSRHDIERELRRRISEGIYLPGSRMPTHRELKHDFGSSPLTLQRAMDRLVEQGYIDTRGFHGTFVAKQLPNLSTIAMVFPDEPGQRLWNHFWTTAKGVAEAWDQDQAHFRIYTIRDSSADSSEHQRLCQDVADRGLAGIVFLDHPYFLAGSPIFSSAIPRVCIGNGEAADMAKFGYSGVTLVEGDVLQRIMSGFHAAGRRRCAVLSALGAANHIRTEYRAQMRRCGLETRAEWWIGLPVDPVGAVAARGVAQLLMSGPGHVRPDCLVIADDNMVPHATAGILDAGLRVPHDLHVAAHANFPGPTLSLVPCLRFGPDMTTQVAAAVSEIATLAAGGKPRVIAVPMTLHS